MPRSRKDRSREPEDLSRRSFLVIAGGVTLGRFILPPLSSGGRSGEVRRLVDEPSRWGEDDRNLLWAELTESGDVEMRAWIPETPEEIEAAEAFYEAASKIDWDEAILGDVPMPESPAKAAKGRGKRPPEPSAAIPSSRPAGRTRGGSKPGRARKSPAREGGSGLIRRWEKHESGAPPAPVAESWMRIEAWLSGHLPRVLASLRPGISAKDLKAFEDAIGCRLPDDVRESWKIHDGQGYVRTDPDDDDEGEFEEGSSVPGLIYGQELLPLQDDGDALGMSSVLDEWRKWAQLAEEAEHSDTGFEAIDRNCTSFPADAIRLRYIDRGWIPFYYDGSGNHFGVDLDPGPNGASGQVINFGRDEERKCVLATSWAQFLEDFADELEAGNYVLDPGHEYGSFLLQWPKQEPLYTQYRAWSEAKLDPEFQGVSPAPADRPSYPVVTGALAEQCAGVVRGFVAAMNEWEARWLRVRPLRELGVSRLVEKQDGELQTYGGITAEPGTRLTPLQKKVASGQPSEREERRVFQLGKYAKEAVAQKRLIFDRFCSPTRTYTGRDLFDQSDPPEYDPELDRVVEVRKVSANHVLVDVQRPDQSRCTRYHLKRGRQGDPWLIDYREQGSEEAGFEKVRL